MARKRETYNERIARGLAKGLSRSQARGHPRRGEKPIRVKWKADALDQGLVDALKHFRASGNLSGAAREAHVSRERFRRFINAERVAERHGRRWTMTDNLVREVDMISEGRRQVVRVRGFEAASLIAQHKAAVHDFIYGRDRDPAVLAPFDGLTVTDTAGRKHPLDTDLNRLLRLAASGNDAFETVYRIVI